MKFVVLIFLLFSISIFSNDKDYDEIKKEVARIDKFVEKGLNSPNIKKKEGRYDVFYVNGEKFRKTLLKENKFIEFDQYMKNDKIILKSFFMKKDIPSLKKFYKDDNKIASYYFNEKGIISSICLHKNEKEKRFLYDDGILKYEYNTINGKNNGKKYRYLKSGKKLLIGIYKDDIVQGKLLNYHKDGKVKLEYFYKDGKRNGKHVEYYSNGKKKIENFFKDDKYTKTWKTWDKNNKLTLSVKFKKDLLYSSNNKPFTGKLIVDSYFKTYYFYKNGMKSSQSIYQDDKLVSNTFFDENGKIKKEDK